MEIQESVSPSSNSQSTDKQRYSNHQILRSLLDTPDRRFQHLPSQIGGQSQILDSLSNTPNNELRNQISQESINATTTYNYPVPIINLQKFNWCKQPMNFSTPKSDSDKNGRYLSTQIYRSQNENLSPYPLGQNVVPDIEALFYKCYKCMYLGIELREFRAHKCNHYKSRNKNLASHYYVQNSTSPSEKFPFVCEICYKKFEFKAYLIVHSLSHDKKQLNKYQCPICQKRLSSSRDLKKHVAIHTNEKFFKCNKCSYGCVKKEYLHLHELAHHTTKKKKRPHQCDKCDASFLQKSELTIHIRNHTGERPYKCQQCGRGFIRAVALTNHKVVHSDKRSYECATCSATYKRKECLMRHIEAKHESEINGLMNFIKCTNSDCSKIFTSRKIMQQHVLMSHNQRTFTCADCGHSVKQKLQLVLHMRRHGFKLPSVKCKHCKKKFATPSSLQQHYKTQHEERHYICEQCGMAFSRLDYFRVHQLKHTNSGGRSYLCAQCGASFYMKHHLKNHEKTHETGKR